MRKLVIILVVAFCGIQLGFSQYDATTANKIKVKFFAAEKSLVNKDYFDAIEKVDEIEALNDGQKGSLTQNIKVKSYLGLGMYARAKQELAVLYKLNPRKEVLVDISSYESKINEGLNEEKANEERARLAEIEKKEEARIAEIKRKEEARIAEIKANKVEDALNYFEYHTCPSCKGKGTEKYMKEYKCNYSPGGINNIYFYGRCNGSGTVSKTPMRDVNPQKIEWTCPECEGSGRRKKQADRNCSECRGRKNILIYTGDNYFSKKEIKDIIDNNSYKIKEIIEKKEEEAASTFNSRSLTDTIYFSALWKETSKANAVYYRTPQKKVNYVYVVNNYYIKNDKLQLEATANKIADNTSSSFVGEAIFYLENGNISSKNYYKNGVLKQAIDYSTSRVTFYYEGSIAKKYLTPKSGVIEDVKYFQNGMINSFKCTYINSSNKKRNLYLSYVCDEQGHLVTKHYHNKKGKIKETYNYN